ncbi:hypothetical protein [Streptomyces rapamycinicus]|uniref:Alpha-L-arabinofuranosidase 1 catalytic domain-containing protein n=2 Tax=Streptomyces rapamycinicus TaxID=1226757 RepID=A0A0A0N5W7_STRRN|nr:hypothetical protein [Streptomyces rapamycinicus]AGP52336.1 hypothetical protein M271_03530 [Streptomyces rapamycinicus NRRL 5491]MBB4779801.1 alpha-N-arabinofuranosidase [Streptomyces rapamycinicus]RLV75541.1 hypothetical protein D3C57_139985 [Streptomyces rapamycinicus NRRL 5491]UTP37610.1 hypothetical protein LIV37_03675 [Streptomyces rapamycinicus NRRL 5491]
MTGVNGAKWYDDAYGMWDSEHNRPAPGIVGKIKQSGIGMIRYPGGTSSNLFNWKGAIGPLEDRTRQVEGKQGATVDSRFGPDEYMAFIRQVGAAPEIMAPFANSTPEEIADWVAYMNAPQGTKWGDLRAENGHPEPYGVRYWEIGNELFGKHQRYWMTIRLGDTTWREVANLTSAGADDRVYAFDPRSGTSHFGDLTAQIHEHGKEGAYVAVSEGGALFFGKNRGAEASSRAASSTAADMSWTAK